MPIHLMMHRQTSLSPLSNCHRPLPSSSDVLGIQGFYQLVQLLSSWPSESPPSFVKVHPLLYVPPVHSKCSPFPTPNLCMHIFGEESKSVSEFLQILLAWSCSLIKVCAFRVPQLPHSLLSKLQCTQILSVPKSEFSSPLGIYLHTSHISKYI